MPKSSFSEALLKWYDTHQRQLPWRARPGMLANPYQVWLSEIMLQQTTVVTVIPYFQKFIARWPTLEDLAKAELDDILHAWQGLGYYSRARNLHKCAQVLHHTYQGHFPPTYEDLKQLPGIGPYTAGAIATIAFGTPAPVVDGNIERVMARVHCIEQPLPQGRSLIAEHMYALMPQSRPGDFVQALMDLGAMVCRPKSPLCEECPVRSFCQAFKEKRVNELPVKKPKAPLPHRYGVVFHVTANNHLLVRRRPSTGLLGGLIELPTTEWQDSWPQAPFKEAPVDATWQSTDSIVNHTFTHFHLHLKIIKASVTQQPVDQPLFWHHEDYLSSLAWPRLMRKALEVIKK